MDRLTAHGTPASGPLRPLAWYVFMSKPRQEALAASKLQEQGYEVFVPTLRIWTRSRAGWATKDTVMFPRYGFVRLGAPTQALGPVRSTPGVTSLVRFGHVLGQLSHSRLESLQQAVQAQAAATPTQPFRPGQHVVFATGPLKGLEAIVSSVAAERVMVLMRLLGAEHTVAVAPQEMALA